MEDKPTGADMEWELSRQAWVRLQEMKRKGKDAATLYERIDRILRDIPDVPVILRRQNRFVISIGGWFLVLREREGRLTLLDIAPGPVHGAQR